MSTLGINTYIDELLRDYIPPDEDPQTILGELAEDETNALLFAALTELKLLREEQFSGDTAVPALLQQQQSRSEGAVDTIATYHSTDEDVSSGGGWSHVDLDFVTGEVDLRFGVDVQVAFAGTGDSDNVVSYSADESPVVGIPVETSNIHVRNDDTSDGTVTVEAWGDA